MKAVFYNKYGSPDVLEVGELEKPKIKEDEILVQAYASSVNPVDWKIRRGDMKILTGKKFPKGLGGDIAGKIVEVGEKVLEFVVGEDVYGKISGFKGNAYAEFVVAKPKDLALKPKDLTFEEAATIPLAALTAYQALTRLGNVKENATVLINGCSGGVGHFAVQIAKALGTEVTGVCSTKNIKLAKKLGADKVIDYTKADVIKNNKKYDIFFDAVAKQSYGKVKPILNRDGRYITTLPSAGAILNSVTGLFSSKKAKMINVKSIPEDLRFISELIKSNKLKPVIDEVYLLDDIIEAHRYSETGRVVGKLAISIK